MNPDLMPLITGATQLSPLERIYATFSPCVFGPTLLASYLGGASPDELRARRGWLPPPPVRRCGYHGASAGEMAAAARLATALRGHGYRFQAVFTAANRAGVEYISRQDAPGTVAALAPWDVPAWVSRAFDQWRPAVLLLIETELWPRLVFEAHRRAVPVLALSARIYPRDIARYRAIRGFMAPTLGRLSRILVQNEVERERFLALGADAGRCAIAGNLKHLEEEPAASAPFDLRRELGLRSAQRLIVFGSVHKSEVALVLEAIKSLDAPDARFIIAPRHASAAETILREAAARGLPAARRSRGQPGNGWRILILDTMGELRTFLLDSHGSGGMRRVWKVRRSQPLRGVASRHAGALWPSLRAFRTRGGHCTGKRSPPAWPAGFQPGSSVRGSGWANGFAGTKTAGGALVALQRRILPDAAAVTRRYLHELSPYLVAVHE